MRKVSRITFFAIFVIGFIVGAVCYSFVSTKILFQNSKFVSAVPSIAPALPNDTFSRAVNITEGVEAVGTLSSSSDTDYYSFVAQKPSYLRIAYKNLPDQVSTYLYSENKVLIAKTTREGIIASASLIKLSQAGKYYLQIKEGSYSPKNPPYAITITFLPLSQD